MSDTKDLTIRLPREALVEVLAQLPYAEWEELQQQVRARRARRLGLEEWEDPDEYEEAGEILKELEAETGTSEMPSIEEVRRILSRIPGSLAADIIAEREDRC